MKKILKFLMYLMLILSFSKSVKAGVNDTVVKGEYFENPLYYEIKNFKDGRFVSTKGNSLTANGVTAYCIEPGTKILNQMYSSNNDLYSSEISKEKIKLFEKIAYYGYGYEGRNNVWWKVATQILIWKNFRNLDNVYIAENSDGTLPINIDIYENLIMNSVRNHDSKPSFDGLSFNYYLGEELVIADNNNILYQFKVGDLNDKIKIFDNKIFLNNLTEDLEIKLSKVLKKRGSNLIYTSLGSQTLFSIGEIDSVYSNLKINYNSGRIDLKKIDSDISEYEDGTLEGAIYSISNCENSIVDYIVTDYRGEAKLTNLPMGEYCISEKTPSLGYDLDKNVYKILIDKNNLNHSVISIENRVVKNHEEETLDDPDVKNNYEEYQLPNTWIIN